MKNRKGITLISLIVTIIIIIILAATTIGLIINNGIIQKAMQAKIDYLESANEESKSLEELYSELLVADTDGSTLGNVDMRTLKSIIQEEVQKATEGATTTPVGTIIAYSVDNVPTGYLKCEGQEVSRTEYAGLFEKIGTTYGEGDGNSTFNLPDLRGEFLRGTGTATRNTGSGDDVGTHQEPSKVKTGIFGTGTSNTDSRLFQYGSTSSSWGSYFDQTILSNGTSRVAYQSTRREIENYQGIEYYTVRPTNTSVLYCIKY